MSTIGDAIRGIQKILTLQVRIDQLEESNRKIGADNNAMASALHDLAVRVARIEGMIEGANMVAPRRPRQPRLPKA